MRLSAMICTVALCLSLGLTNAYAFVNMCTFALPNDRVAELADEQIFEVQDGVFHKPARVNLLNKTLSTLRPGDVVLSGGEVHVVLEI